MTNATNTINALADALVYNNRFFTKKVQGDQIGAEALAVWKKSVDTLHRAAYAAYEKCENSHGAVDTTTVDKTDIFNALRPLLAMIGNVNEHRMYANAEMAILMIGYAGKRGADKSDALKDCENRISHKKAEISSYEKLNVTDAEYKATRLAELNAQLETLQAEKDALIDAPDNRKAKPTRTSPESFRLDAEHLFARAITGQMAKSLAELDAEDAARAEARKARSAARRAAKKAATAQPVQNA